MQPSTTKKPVMDVLAPAQPAPTTSLPVREAPHTANTESRSEKQPDTTASGSLLAQQQAVNKKDTEKHYTQQPGPQPIKEHTTPTGAIVTAIVVMLLLSGLTIAIYLKG